MFTLELAGNTARMNVTFRTLHDVLIRQLLLNYLILNLAMLKNNVLTRTNTLLRQLKSYIDNNLNQRQFYTSTEYQKNSK